jgi:hypothetical protein
MVLWGSRSTNRNRVELFETLQAERERMSEIRRIP